MAFDPHFDKVSLLLHCDGANGSTTFVDSSPRPKTVTSYGGTQISTAQSKFGGASSYFNGARAEVAQSIDFDFGEGDFTLETWVYPIGTATSCLFGARIAESGVGFEIYITATNTFYIQSAGTPSYIESPNSTIAAGLWQHLAVVRHQGVTTLYHKGVNKGSSSSPLNVSPNPISLVIGANRNGLYPFNGYIDDLRITKGVARYTANFTPPTEPFPNTATEPVSAYAASATPLGAPSARASFGHYFYARASAPSVLAPPQALALHARAAYAAAPGPLGTPTVLTAALVRAYGSAPSMLGAGAATVYLPLGARIAAPSPLGAPQAPAFHDFTGQLGDTITRYVMDLITPDGTHRVPISSWQATLQTGSSNYVQCVIPACGAWVDTLNAASEFVIWRRAVLPSGAAIEYEMARAPAATLAFDQSPSRHTCTLSGYSTAFAESLDPPAAYDRELTGLRTISSGSALRVRCAVDWLLRPGHRAYVQGVPFVVRYINYYAPAGFDSYMDVGE